MMSLILTETLGYVYLITQYHFLFPFSFLFQPKVINSKLALISHTLVQHTNNTAVYMHTCNYTHRDNNNNNNNNNNTEI